MDDAFSKWMEVIPTRTTTQVHEQFKKYEQSFQLLNFIISWCQIMDKKLVSDEFEEFQKTSGIIHRKSAPYHPGSNGRAERYVQTMK